MRVAVQAFKDGSERVMLGNVILKEKPVRKKARRTGWTFSIEMLRLREIEKVIRSRHGGMIPDPGGTDDRETCLAYIKAAALALSGQDIGNWCAKWAPWAKEHEISALDAMASGRRRMMTADGVAGLLMVTWDERVRLDLKTFGASDLTKGERGKLTKERKRDRDRHRKAEIRKARGSKDRKSYEAQSLSAQKPWEVEGLSRATWYRRRETGASRVDIYSKGDTLVSIPNGDTLASTSDGLPPTLPPASKPIAVGVAGRGRGLGDHPPAELQEAAPHGSGGISREQAA